jgi:hypothetical protein
MDMPNYYNMLLTRRKIRYWQSRSRGYKAPQLFWRITSRPQDIKLYQALAEYQYHIPEFALFLARVDKFFKDTKQIKQWINECRDYEYQLATQNAQNIAQLTPLPSDIQDHILSPMLNTRPPRRIK